MKKAKNLSLLIGVACILTVVVWRLVKAVFHYFSVLNENGFNYFIAGDALPLAIVVLSLITPTVLLVRNPKNKTGRVLPIISIIINGAVLLVLLPLSLTSTIPQYLIYSKLGLINTYFTVIMSYFEGGGILFLIGYLALIIGSFLSLPKKKQTVNNQDAP